MISKIEKETVSDLMLLKELVFSALKQQKITRQLKDFETKSFIQQLENKRKGINA